MIEGMPVFGEHVRNQMSAMHPSSVWNWLTPFIKFRRFLLVSVVISVNPIESEESVADTLCRYVFHSLVVSLGYQINHKSDPKKLKNMATNNDDVVSCGDSAAETSNAPTPVDAISATAQSLATDLTAQAFGGVLRDYRLQEIDCSGGDAGESARGCREKPRRNNGAFSSENTNSVHSFVSDMGDPCASAFGCYIEHFRGTHGVLSSGRPF